VKDNVPTQHTLTVTVDPSMRVVIASPEGLTLCTDSDPEKVGRALLQWVGTARRIALGEMATERPASCDAMLSLLDADTDDGGDDLP
jgi:hypothetical protein